MANNVNIPAQGTGDTTPKVSTDQVSADSSQVQNFQQVSVSGGVLTRNPTIPVSAVSLPLPTGAALDASVTAQNALYGAVNETAPATDTASSGLNGRLQRVAQRLTSLIALLPASLGQKTMANGLAVTIASDQSAIPVSGTIAVSGTMPISAALGVEVDGHSANIGALADASSASTLTGLLKNIKAALAGTLTVSGAVTTTPSVPVQAATATLANVAGSASSVTLQALNASRKGLVIVNDSTAILYIKFGSAASTTSYTYYLAGTVSGAPSILELPAVTYTGIVTGIWASATGNARMTELT